MLLSIAEVTQITAAICSLEKEKKEEKDNNKIHD